MRRSAKVVLVTNIPNPYRIPQFNLLQDSLARADIDLSVVYGARGYRERKWTFDDAEVQHSAQYLDDRIRTSPPLWYTGFLRMLFRERPDVIVGNGFSIATIKAAMYALLSGGRFLIMAETIAHSKGILGTMLGWGRGVLASLASELLLSGTKSKEYVQALPFARNTPVTTGVLNIDTEAFTRVYRERMNAETSARMNLLFVGYLNARKNARAVIELAAQMKMKRQDFHLYIVGDGEERAALEALAKNHALHDCLSFDGYKQKHELLPYYQAADIFLFPTRYDIWGLVLNEAMAAGLACVVSETAYAHVDLVREGETGFVRDFNRLDEVEHLLHGLLDDPVRVRTIGDQAAEFILQHESLAHSVQRISSVVERHMTGQTKA